MKMQSGFSLVEGLLIAVVLTVVGFGGWYVWDMNNNRETSKQYPVQENTENEKVPTSEEPTTHEGWKKYSNENFSLTFYYPSDWDMSSRPYSTLSLVFLSSNYSAPVNQEGYNQIDQGYNMDVSVNTSGYTTVNNVEIPSNCTPDPVVSTDSKLSISCNEGFEYRKHQYILKSGKLYEFDLSGSTIDVEGVTTLFDQVLRTIKIQ